jgi:hypothetical protein
VARVRLQPQAIGPVPAKIDGSRDFRRLLGLLNQPHAAMGTWTLARPVWHCSMRAAPQDKMLSDGEWAQIAYVVMHRTGDRTAARGPSRAESEKAGRRGLPAAPRLTLRRQVSTAAAAADEQEFFAGLR